MFVYEYFVLQSVNYLLTEHGIITQQDAQQMMK